MSPQRIQRKRTKGWRMPEGAVYVGRGSRWGNPFPVVEPWLPEDVCRMYLELVTDRVAHFVDNPGTRWETHMTFKASNWPVNRYGAHAPRAKDIRTELAGKDLACWCPLDQPCHADVMLELANGTTA